MIDLQAETDDKIMINDKIKSHHSFIIQNDNLFKHLFTTLSSTYFLSQNIINRLNHIATQKLLSIKCFLKIIVIE